jgi:peptide/nickel transport system substrate-binding protein
MVTQSIVQSPDEPAGLDADAGRRTREETPEMSRTTDPTLGRRGLAFAVGIVALFSVLVAGCSDDSDSTSDNAVTSSEGSTVEISDTEVPEVTMGLTSPDLALNLLNGPTIPNISLMANVAQGLVAYDADGELQPSLASEWEAVSPTEYVYTVKPGQKFSNGDPVTAEDIAYSMNYAMDPETGSVTSSFYLTVKSIEATADDEVTVTLKTPDPTWDYVPGTYPGWIYDKDSLAAGENFGGPKGIPVGSGPYAITEFTADHVTFERNEFFDGPTPPVAKFVVNLIDDDGTRLAAMQAGDIDGALYVPLQATQQWSELPDVELFSATSPALDLMWFNTTKPPFDDAHVRRAFMYAFNRDAVVENVLHGNAAVAEPQVLPEFWVNEMSAEEAEERTDEQGPPYPYDMEKAKDELAQSSQAGGFSTTAYYTASAPELGLALQGLSESLSELNIDLELKELTDAAYYERAGSGDFEMLSSTGAFDYPDPLGYYYLVNCGCAAAPNGFNFSRYSNPDVDRLFKEAYADTNDDTRVDKILEIVSTIATDVPSPTLWFRNSVTALRSGLVLSDLGPWTTLVTPWMAKIGEPAS